MNKKLFFILAMFFFMHSNAQIQTTAPVAQAVETCQGKTTLTVSIDPQATVAQFTVDVAFASGVIYASQVTASNASLGSVDDTNLNNIGITLTPDGSNNVIELVIDRQASCGSSSDENTRDEVTVNTDTQQSNPYEIFGATLTFTSPDPLIDVQINTPYNRTLTLQNGSAQAPLREVYMLATITNATATYSSTDVTIDDLGNGYYKITAINPAGILVGETVTIEEEITPLGCGSPGAFYELWYSCNSNSPDMHTEADKCQPSEGEGAITIEAGNISIDMPRVQLFDFTSLCQTEDYFFRSRIINNATTTNSASALYDLKVMMSHSNQILLDLPTTTEVLLYVINTAPSNDFGGGQIDPIDITSHVVENELERITNTSSTEYYFFSIDLNDLLTSTTPVGLQDLDGDGFFDDLPAGYSLYIDWKYEQPCFNEGDTLPDGRTYDCENSRYYFTYGNRLEYRELCDDSSSTRKSLYGTRPLNPNTQGVFTSSQAIVVIPPAMESGMRIEGAIFDIKRSYRFRTNQSRLQYKITLPDDLTIDENTIFWYSNAAYPGSDESLYVPINPAGDLYSKVGNVVTLTAPIASTSGHFKFDWVLADNCTNGGPQTIDIKTKWIADIDTNCECNPIISCIDTEVTFLCAGNCPEGGVGMSRLPRIEREDSALGYVDYTMTTKQDRSNIPARELAFALVFDTIRAEGVGAQAALVGETADNLFHAMEIGNSSGVDWLQPLSIDVEIFAAGVDMDDAASIPLVDNTLDASAATTIHDSGTERIEWNLTSLLPAGEMLAGYQLRTSARYVVNNASTIPSANEQRGQTFYYYNINDAGDEKTCFQVPAELYLSRTLNTGDMVTDSPGTINGCLGDRLRFISFHNFFGQGQPFTRYTTEYRPSEVIRQFRLIAPANAVIDKSTLVFRVFRLTNYADLDNVTEIFQTFTIPESNVTEISPGEYLVSVDPSWPIPAFGARHLGNNYNIFFTVIPSCTDLTTISTNPSSSANQATIVVDLTRFYYAHEDRNDTDSFFTRTTAYTRQHVVNQPQMFYTGLQTIANAINDSERWSVQFSNQGTAIADHPYLFIPNATGISISSVSGSTSSTTYPDGTVYEFASLAQGNSILSNIDFTYTTCAPQDIDARIGWSCQELPSNTGQPFLSQIDQAYCLQPMQLTFIPQQADVEIFESTSNPDPARAGAVDICSPLQYEYIVNNKGDGPIKENVFSITMPTGLSIRDVQVQFPVGGAWESVSVTDNGIEQLVKVSEHSELQPVGVYVRGTRSSDVTATNRQYAVRFTADMDCEFISGTGFRLQALGNSICDSPARNSEQKIPTVPITLDGGALDFSLAASATDVEFNSCGETKQLTFNFLKNDDLSIDTATDSIIVTLPLDFTENGILQSINDVNFTDVAVSAVEQVGATARILKWAVPDLSTAETSNGQGKTLSYTIDLVYNGDGLCGTFPVNASLTRRGEKVCDLNSDGDTSDPFEKTCTLNLPSVSGGSTLTVITPSLLITEMDIIVVNQEEIEITTKVSNISTQAGLDVSEAAIDLYLDENSNGFIDDGEPIITTINTGAIAVGAEVTTVDDTYNNTVNLYDFNKGVIGVIRRANPTNCLCEDASRVSTLPVVLTSFEAKSNDCKVELTWETALEVNHSHFELYYSVDGLSYTYLSRVDAAGNATGSKYEYVDNEAREGDNYYRLKQVDTDGTEELFSQVAFAKNNCETSWKIYPNPIKRGEEMNITGKEIRSVSIFNASGALVYQNDYATQQREVNIVVDLAKGSYVVTINKQESKTIVVQ